MERVIAVLTDGIQAAYRACIPHKRRQFGTLGLSDEILTLIDERRAAIRRWQRSRDSTTRERAKILDRGIQEAISALVNERFGRSVRRLNNDPGPHERKFWKLFRDLRRRPMVTPTLYSPRTAP